MEIELVWKHRKDGVEYCLMCGDGICGSVTINPLIESNVSAGGCGIALWGCCGCDRGCDFEFTGKVCDVKENIEKGVVAFFKKCFGHHLVVHVDDSMFGNYLNTNTGWHEY